MPTSTAMARTCCGRSSATKTPSPLAPALSTSSTQRRHQNNNRLDQLLEKMEEEAEEQVYDFAQEDLFYLTTKDPSLRQHINCTIPSRDRFIDQAQAFLARIVRQSGMDEMKVKPL